MSKNFVAADAASHNYDVGQALKAAFTGSRVTGFTAEVAADLAKKHGDEGMRIPFAAICKATGASNAVGGATAVVAYDHENAITEIDAAVKAEILGAKFGVTMKSTAEAEYRIYRADSRPTATTMDIDTVIPDGGGTTAGFVSIKPVQVATTIELANSLDFTRPDVAQLVSRMVVDAVALEIDRILIEGYGPFASGLTWAGMAAIAQNTGLTLNQASTISGWAAVREEYGAYVQRTDLSGARWLAHPRVVDSVLPTSPLFAGSLNAIAQGGGITTLLGHSIVQGRLPVVTGAPDTTQVYFGNPEEIHAIMFSSGSIALVVNPYADSVFNKGASLLRVIAAVGMGVRDPKKLYRATVQLP